MARPASKQPTDGELAILQVLWNDGPSTVRDVHVELVESGRSHAGYTSTLKLMQIMFEKRLVARDESRRSHVYEPRLTREKAQKGLVCELVERAFAGSAAQLALNALSSKPVSRNEIAAIRKLLDEREASERRKPNRGRGKR